VGSLPASAVVQQDVSTQLPQLALDATRVRLLVRNLLDNALRFTPAGGAAPVISAQPDATSGVQLVVRDFGPGVSEDQLSKLGQPFYRPDTARTREGGGVGLGLYLCRLVAQAHGGTFVVRNAQPGLQVAVHLPRQTGAAKP
jgi:signal transduction histidine kinase